jgi:hypothetical protein
MSDTVHPFLYPSTIMPGAGAVTEVESPTVEARGTPLLVVRGDPYPGSVRTFRRLGFVIAAWSQRALRALGIDGLIVDAPTPLRRPIRRACLATRA